MKKNVFFVAMLSIVMASCGGLESKAEALAEKRCECKSLDGDAKDKCKEELEENQKEFKKELEEAKLSKEEEEKLEDAYDAKYKECKKS